MQNILKYTSTILQSSRAIQKKIIMWIRELLAEFLILYFRSQAEAAPADLLPFNRSMEKHNSKNEIKFETKVNR